MSASPLHFPRLVIAAPRSGEGKTTVFTALAALFQGQGLAVRAFKVGPDFIDPGHHAAIVGTPSRNLDSVLMPPVAVLQGFSQGATQEGVNLVEGVMGLFDGRGSGPQGSTADIARLIQAPVLLCLKAGGFSRSAAALVRGFADFEPGLVAGVVITAASSESHYALLKQVIEGEAGVPCFGYMPKHPDLVLESRHLGLIPAEELGDFHHRLNRLADLSHLDLDGLLHLARSAPALPACAPNTHTFPSIPAPAGRPIRLGVARDRAFSFYYQDNLDLFTALGAELVFFSPLETDSLPPDLDGLYLGGGFPEVFAQELTARVALRRELRAALEAGLPCLAECGGMLYLCRGLTDGEGTRHEMVGFFAAEAVMTAGLQRPFGYVDVEQLAAGPLGPAGLCFCAHEFHYSRLETDEPAALRISKPGGTAQTAGMLRGNCLGLYPHLHFAGMPEAARHFLEFCRARTL